MDRQRCGYVRRIHGANGGVKHRNEGVIGLKIVADIHAREAIALRRRLKILSIALIALAVLIWR